MAERPKVTGLSGFGLEVPDLADAEAFYGAFGLDADRRGEALVMGSPGRDHEEAVVNAGARKRLHHVSFFIEPDDTEAFAEALKRDGLDVSEGAPDGWVRPGLWFQDPWGTWINLTPKRPVTRAFDPAPPSNQNGAGERVDMHLWRELPKARPPRRIGHMLMFTQDWEKTEAFLTKTLGLRTSDRVAGKVMFMAAGDGVTDHHCFGLINSTHRGLQHTSFQVANFDDIGFGAWRMNEAGYKEAFGPGRHALASNLFHYTRDPWGSWIEYYADMDQISPAWRCQDFDTLPYIWGPEWSPEFWGGEMNANLEPAD
jgi:catechol-2,3-dioxygenase